MSGQFGQHVSLEDRIREILTGYPDNAVLKEMIQNADDAGATVVRFALDERQHAGESAGGEDAWFAGFEPYLGPALLSYNDAAFTEEDLTSIQNIGRSCKKHNVTKTGRFGIGFNSVYHVTDLPSFASGANVCFFDPSCSCLPRHGPGFRVDLASEAHQEKIRRNRDMFAPYDAFGARVSAAEPLAGTLFRLPLRSEAQARASLVRNVAFTAATVGAVFENFKAEAASMLLFLKSVRALELYTFAPHAGAAAELIYSTKLVDLSDDDVQTRRFFQKQPAANHSSNLRLNVLTEHVATGVREMKKWLVCQTTGEGTALRVMEHPLVKKLGMKLLPWGGVACPVEGEEKEEGGLSGRAFCFLPMPVETGLPLHVNGYFELPSDRRGIFWSPDDAVGEAHLRRDWNRALLVDNVAASYVACLTALKETASDGGDRRIDSFYALIPPKHVAMPWALTADAVTAKLVDYPCLHCGVAVGWQRPSDCFVARVAVDGSLLRVLRKAGLCIAQPPDAVYDRLVDLSTALSLASACAALPAAFEKTAPPVETARKPAETARTAESGVGKTSPAPSSAAADAGAVSAGSWTQDDACVLLEWLVAQVYAATSGCPPSAQACFSAVPLAPLLSGSVGRFTAGEPGLAFSDRAAVNDLFRGHPAARGMLDWPFVAARHPYLAGKLRSEDARVLLKVRETTGSVMIEQLRDVLPAELATADAGGRRVAVDAEMHAWLERFWGVVAEVDENLPDRSKKMPSSREGWALLPLAAPLDGPAQRYVARLTARSPGGSTAGDDGWVDRGESLPPVVLRNTTDASLDDILLSLGAAVAVVPLTKRLVPSYVDPPTVASTFRILVQLRRKLAALPHHAPAVRTWLTRHHHSIDDSSIRFARLLPVWQAFSNPVHSDDTTTTTTTTTAATTLVALEDDAGHQLLPAAIARGPVALVLRRHADATDGERVVLRRGGAAEMRDDDFWAEFLGGFAETLAAFPRARVVGAVRQLVKACPNLPPPFVAGVRGAPVVPTQTGEFRAAASLFDCTAPGLSAFVPEHRFVDAEFATSDVRGILVSLGTMTTLTAPALEELAVELSQESEPDFERAAALLAYLDQHLEHFVDAGALGFLKKMISRGPNKLLAKLGAVAWFPHLLQPPDDFVRLPPAPRLAAAADVRPLDQFWLCCHSKKILPFNPGPALCRHFGWDELSADDLATQLVTLSRDLEASTGETRQRVSDIINTKVVNDLYKALEQHRMAGTLTATAEKALEGQAIVWVGDRFAPTLCVAESVPVHLNDLPDLYALPATLRRHAKLLQALGMRKEFTPDSYAHALHCLRREQDGKPLSDAQLRVVSALITSLAPEARHVDQMVLPDEDGVLRPPSELLYNDMPWEQLVVNSAEAKGKRVAHPSLSHATSAAFGVISRRELVVLDDGCTDTEWEGEAYGQSESITSRLRGILNEYSDDIGILNELVQNADDAGATEFHVLLDKNTYGSKSLLSPALAEWQGPAVFVRNNAVFTEADFKNLARVGSGAKLESTAKTGRFGLGFNAVYHWTDTPSFVSGNSFVVLDPHRLYVKGSRDAPGRKMQFPSPGHHSVFQRFEDQFEPFRANDPSCSFLERYDATLFRFPLRTSAAAARSDIRKKVYTTGDAETLITDFCSSALELLLFLKNVREVKVFVKEPGAAAPVEIFSVAAAPDTASQAARTSLHKFVGGHGSSTSARESFKIRLSATKDADLPRYLSTVSVAAFQRSPLFSSLPRKEKKTLHSRGEGSTPASSLLSSGHEAEILPPAAPRTLRFEQEWVVSAGIGAGDAKRISLESDGTKRFIPWGSIAVLSSARRWAGAPAADPRCDNPLRPQAASAAKTPGKQKKPLSASGRRLDINGDATGEGEALLQFEGGASDEDAYEMQEPVRNEFDRRFIRGQRAAEGDSAGGEEEVLETENPEVDGRAFAFLPLPQVTGLRFHVNGAFELSSNRRNIWFDDAYKSQSMGELAAWNCAVLKDACAPAAVRLLHHVKDRLGAAAFYSLFPSAELHGPWAVFAKAFYESLRGERLLHSAVRGGSWVCPAEAVFVAAEASEDEPPGTLPPKLPNGGFRISTVVRALLGVGCAVVRAPEFVVGSFQKLADAVLVTPGLVRDTFTAQHPANTDDLDKMQLLAYAASDLGTSQNSFRKLRGLRLLPLEDKRYAAFADDADDAGLVFVCHRRELCEPAPQRFARVPLLIQAGVLLSDIQNQVFEATNLKYLSPDRLYKSLPWLLPRLQNVPRIAREDPEAPAQKWVAAFWEVVGRDKVDAGLAWPVVPAVRSYISPAEAARAVLKSARVEFLDALGVDLVPEQQPGYSHLIQADSPPVVLDALFAAHGDGTAEAVRAGGAPARKKLLDYFADAAAAPGELGPSHAALLKRLPIFPLLSKGDAAAAEFRDSFFLPPLPVPEKDPILDPTLLAEAGCFYDVSGATSPSRCKRMLERLGAVRMTLAAFCVGHLLARPGSFAQGPRDNAYRHILGRRDLLQNQEVREALRGAAWVPAGGGFKRPSELLDPKLRSLAGGGVPGDLFPAPGFIDVARKSSEALLRRMHKDLGLRVDLDSDTLYSAAKALSGGDDPSAQARKFVEYIASPDSNISDADLQALVDVPCIPVARARDQGVATDERIIPKHGLMTPRATRGEADAALCSYSYGIAAFELPARLRDLWWRDPVAPRALVTQVIRLADGFEPGPGGVAYGIEQLYTEISARLPAEGAPAAAGDRQQLETAALAEVNRLRAAPSVFVNDAFLSPAHVSLAALEIPAGRYLRHVPDSSVGEWVDGRWKPLCAALGIRNHFTPADYAGVLARLEDDKNGQPLEDAELTMVVDIARCAAGTVPRLITHLPDMAKVLRAKARLVYNDMAWGATEAAIGPVWLLHPSVPREVVQALGVMSRRSYTMQQSQNKDLFCPTPDDVQRAVSGAELRDVLLDVLEVARLFHTRTATFVLDNRSHESTAVLPGTEACLGPAVLVHFDAPIPVAALPKLFSRDAAPAACGARFLSVFLLADIAQVCTSSTYFEFDPLSGTSTSFGFDTLARNFPEQLSLFRGYHTTGTALRLHLRRGAASAFGPPAAAGALLPALTALAPMLLPLEPTLEAVVVREFQAVPDASPSGEAAAGAAGESEAPPEASVELLVAAVKRGGELRSEAFRAAEAEAQNQGFLAKLAQRAAKSPGGAVKTFRVDVAVRTAGDADGEASGYYSWLATTACNAGDSQAVAAQLGVQLKPAGGVASLIMRDGCPLSAAKVARYLSRSTDPNDPARYVPVHLSFPNPTPRSSFPPAHAAAWAPACAQNVWAAYSSHLVEFAAVIDTFEAPVFLYHYFPDLAGVPGDAPGWIQAGLRSVYASFKGKPVFRLKGRYQKPADGKFAVTDLDSVVVAKLNAAIFDVPLHVAKSYVASAPGARTVSGEDVRRMFSTGNAAAVNFKDLDHLHIVQLLELAVSDLSRAPAAFQPLANVHLLLLEGVDAPNAPPVVVPFGHSRTTLVGGAAERRLLPGKSACFVHRKVLENEALKQVFEDPNFQRDMGLRKVTAREVFENMESTGVPAEWRSRGAVPKEEAAKVPKEWFDAFWAVADPAEVAPKDGRAPWPVLPLADGSLAPAAAVAYAFYFGAAAPPASPAGSGSSASYASAHEPEEPQTAPAPTPPPSTPSLGLSITDVLFGFLRPSSAETDPFPFNHLPDPEDVRTIVQRLQLPVLPPDFSGGARFQPSGAAAVVVAKKVRAASAAGAVDWEACGDGPKADLAAYFAGHVDDFSSSKHASAVVEALPIFRTLAPQPGTVPSFVHLERRRTYRCAARGPPFFQPDATWLRDEHMPFLQALSVTVKHVPQSKVWTEQLLPRLAEATPEQRHDQLSYLRQNYGDLGEGEEEVTEYLRTKPCFPNCNQTLMMPSQFLHPDLRLVKDVFGEDTSLFPDVPYCEPQWLQFLERIGLKAQVDAQVFLACAQRLHSERDNPVDEAVMAKAASLAEIVKGQTDELLSTAPNKDAFTRTVRTLHIIPLVHPKTNERKLFTFSQCVLQRDAHLAAYSMPMLPDAWTPRHKAQQSAMGIVSPPSIDMIVLSLKNTSEDCMGPAYPLLRDSLTGEPTLDAAGEEVADTVVHEHFCKVLEHLHTKMGGSVLWTSTKKQINAAPCIPITTSVPAPPSRVFFFADSPPVHLPPFVMALSSTSQYYTKEALEVLADVGVRERPTLQDLEAILEDVIRSRAGTPFNLTELNSFLKLLEVMARQAPKGHLQVTHVPDIHNVLKPVTASVFNDAPWLLSRMKEDVVSFAHPRLNRALCEKIGVKTVQKVVSEDIEDEDSLQYVSEEEAQVWTDRLRSPEFVSCLLDLAAGQGAEVLDELVLQQSLKKCTVRFVAKLSTILMADVNGRQRVVVHSHAKECHYYVSEDAGRHVFYVSPLPPQLSVPSVLARCVCLAVKLARWPAFLGDVLQAEPAAMKAQLALLRVAADASRTDPHMANANARGVLGKAVVDEDVDGLKMQPHRRHTNGECVAYSDEARVKRYGEVVCEAAAGRGPVTAVRHYDVNTGLRIKSIPVTDIYTLSRDPSQSDPWPAPPAAWVDPQDATSVVLRADEARNEREVVANVLTGLMKKLDIPLGASEEELTNRLEDSRIRLKKAEEELAKARRDNERLRSEKEAVQGRGTCPVCYDKLFDAALSCGHCFCTDCVSSIRSTSSTCPFCRLPIESVLAIKPDF